MIVTKFGHSCILVEVKSEDARRVALFDPGCWSEVSLESLEQLDDIFISHGHPDHLDIEKLRLIVGKFPEARITAPTEVVESLRGAGFAGAGDVAPTGASFFISPHEGHEPFLLPPQEIGIHFMNIYSHPGDSHSFRETMPVLALPVQAPWGSTIAAVDLALELKPQFIVPIHDWHWKDEAREATYNQLEQLFAEQGITFLKPVDGVPMTISI